MAFEVLRNLQYGSGCDCGQNLNHHPSRIIPLSFLDDSDLVESESCDILSFVPPRLGEVMILKNPNKQLPEPAAYFQGTNSFLKSYLYLHSIEYYQYCHLPRRGEEILTKFLMDLCKNNEEKSKGKVKKLIQSIMNTGREMFDTDPDNNSYFSEFYELLLSDKKTQVIIVQSSNDKTFSRTIPSKLPKLTLEKTETAITCYILLLLPNGQFSPYGRAWLK